MSKRKTAAELMVELRKDQKFQQAMAEREGRRVKRQEQYDAILAPVVSGLNAVGLKGNSLQEVIAIAGPLHDEAVQLLLKALDTMEEPRPVESIVRSLAAAEKQFDGRRLANMFEETDDESLRWAIVNTISIVRPHSIDHWIRERFSSPPWSQLLAQKSG